MAEGPTFNPSNYTVNIEGQRPQGVNSGGPAEVLVHTPPTKDSPGQTRYSTYDDTTKTRVNYTAFSPPTPGNTSGIESPSAIRIGENTAPPTPTTLEQVVTPNQAATARQYDAYQDSSRLATYAADQIRDRINMTPIESPRDSIINGLLSRGNFYEKMSDNKGRILLRPGDKELLMKLIESNKAGEGTEVIVTIGYSTFKIEKTAKISTISAANYGPRIAVNGFMGKNTIIEPTRVNPTDLSPHPSIPTPSLAKAA